MGFFDSLIGGYNEDKKAKEEFTLKIKDAGRAYIIDSGKYISGPFVTEKVLSGVVYVNKRGLFFQVVPAAKCVVIYVEDIQKMEIIYIKRKCIRIEYKNENKFETLIMEVYNAEGCIIELQRAIEEHNAEKQICQRDEDSENIENKDDILSTIEKLSAIKDCGAITEEEFELKKKELLSRL